MTTLAARNCNDVEDASIASSLTTKQEQELQVAFGEDLGTGDMARAEHMMPEHV